MSQASGLVVVDKSGAMTSHDVVEAFEMKEIPRA